MGKCEGFLELIHAYIDNELLPEETKQLKSHLSSCTDCQKSVEMFRILKTTLKEKLTPVSAPVSLRERIAKKQTNSIWLNHIFTFPRLATAFVTMAIILSGILFYHQEIKPAHFLVLHADAKIQKHIDDCPNCQKSSVKTIEQHIKTVSSKKNQLQKHLDNCSDCQQTIVKRIDHCMESMAENIQPGFFVFC